MLIFTNEILISESDLCSVADYLHKMHMNISYPNNMSCKRTLKCSRLCTFNSGAKHIMQCNAMMIERYRNKLSPKACLSYLLQMLICCSIFRITFILLVILQELSNFYAIQCFFII